jgi:hypothetical protein
LAKKLGRVSRRRIDLIVSLVWINTMRPLHELRAPVKVAAPGQKISAVSAAVWSPKAMRTHAKMLIAAQSQGPVGYFKLGADLNDGRWPVWEIPEKILEPGS